MAKRPGRPRKPIQQEKFVGFFVTNAQYSIMQHKIAQSGLSVSEYMRELALDGKVMARWEPEERELFKKLVGISNDVHRLVQVSEEQGVPKAVLYFEECRNLIDEIIKKFNHEQQSISHGEDLPGDL